MPEVALSGRQRHKQRRQSNSRLVIQDCHAMFMKSSDTKPIRYLSASGNNTETPFSGDSQIILPMGRDGFGLDICPLSHSPIFKIALGMTSESKHSHDSCWQKTFVLRVRLLGCSFTQHFESNFEKTKRTVH